MREAAKVLGLDLNKSTVSVQGYGNAGYYIAYLAHGLLGCKIVAVSDSKGGIYNKAGLDPKAVLEHKLATGSVVDFPNSEPISNEELLQLEVDILFPAALEEVITKENAPYIKARIIGELANGPTTPEADEILHKNNVHVIPDFLCNAGGVTVSYFEMVQNAYMYYWDDKRIYDLLERKMVEAYYSVLNTSIEYKIDMRQAAYVVALQRLAEAIKVRGWA